MNGLRPVSARTGALHWIGAAIVLAYFAWFVGPSLSGRFNADDPMNIYYYWQRGTGQLVKNLLLFFTTYGRPMGGVYYRLLYYFFGLNPLPYHIVTACLLLVNTFLAYRFGRLLTGSQITGGFTALVIAYHAQMAGLAYLPSFIFDVLSFTFYFWAFTYYLGVRTRGEPLRKGQIAIFLLLYIGALESKEMAVTLPVMVLLYEALLHPSQRWSLANLWKWARTDALPSLEAGALTLVYILGKTLGAEALVKTELYRPVFTWSRYQESTARFCNTIFYQRAFFRMPTILLLMAILLAIAWLRKDKVLFFLWCFVWIAPLPVTFLPGRDQAQIYLLLAAWAVTAAALFTAFCEAISKPIARRAPSLIVRGALILAGVVLLWAKTQHENRNLAGWVEGATGRTWAVLQEIRSVQPAVKPKSNIYVRNDWTPGYETKFIMELNYHDPSVRVWFEQHPPLPAGVKIENMDYVFTYEKGRIKKLK